MPDALLTRALVGLAVALLGCRRTAPPEAGGPSASPCAATAAIAARPPPDRYPLHERVVATVFWVGEPASPDNGAIHNRSSAWEEDWVGRFGGVDTPDARRGFCPRAFVPKENPFYVALPYDDRDEEGEVRPTAASAIPWFAEPGVDGPSAVRHRWVEVSRGDRRCYGQWEDVGPYLEDDAAYVFGGAPPRNEIAPGAGIDLSPAMATCAGVDGVAEVAWRFIDRADVPPGPWLARVSGPR